MVDQLFSVDHVSGAAVPQGFVRDSTLLMLLCTAELTPRPQVPLNADGRQIHVLSSLSHVHSVVDKFSHCWHDVELLVSV